MRHANARLDLLRKGQRSKVIALSLYHQPNRLSRMNIQCALRYQISVHRRIKPAVVNDVVDMAINVVI